jgi:diaminopimelate epimerase
MKFIKMHGIGNDYVYINGFVERVDDPARLAVAVADRHFGVGGDGLILVLPPQSGVDAHVRMRMFNADGSESEMCGNGIRCVCKLAHDHGISDARPMRVQTGAGVLTLDYRLDGEGNVEQVTVDMGEPVLNLADVPVDAAQLLETDAAHEYRLPITQGDDLRMTFVSMGNPHAMIYHTNVGAIDLSKTGPLLENHLAFPRRMNVHFVQVHSPDEVTMRTWERGSGITLACGTGASAVCVAGVLTGRTNRKILVHLPGGDLTLQWRQADNHVFMTGGATQVFTGVWPD